MKGRWLKRSSVLIAMMISLCSFSTVAYAEAEKETIEITVPVYHY